MDINNLNIDKRNIRKYNPTYLSFESDRIKGAIATAAQSVLYWFSIIFYCQYLWISNQSYALTTWFLFT